jgi:hypothetical protein
MELARSAEHGWRWHESGTLVKLAQSGAEHRPSQHGQPSPLQQKLIPLYFFIPGRCLPERNACTVIGFPLLEGARRCGTAPGLRDSVLPPSYGGAHV